MFRTTNSLILKDILKITGMNNNYNDTQHEKKPYLQHVYVCS